MLATVIAGMVVTDKPEKTNITTSVVDAAPVPLAGANLIWDAKLSGFGLKVTPKGKRVYVYRYRLGGRAGKTRRVTIGEHGNPCTAASGRKFAAELANSVRIRIDPADEMKERIEADPEAKALSDRYPIATSTG